MKRMAVVAAIAGVLLMAVAGLLATPWPAVWCMRHLFGGESHAKLPDERAVRDATEVAYDLRYPSQWKQNSWDLYMPKDAKGKVPVVVWLHGGAFVAGSKEGVTPWGLTLAAHGYAVAAPDYAWAGDVAYPTQAKQVQEFLAELERASAAGELPFDMSRVVLAGDSAGAFLAAQAALVATNAAYAEEIGVASALAPGAVRATLLFCGPYNMETILEGLEGMGDAKLSYVVNKTAWAFFGTPFWKKLPSVATTAVCDWVTPSFPPSFVSDGNGISFEREGMELANTLARHGVAVESLFFPHEEDVDVVDHEYQMNLVSPEGACAWERSWAFLQEHCPV